MANGNVLRNATALKRHRSSQLPEDFFPSKDLFSFASLEKSSQKERKTIFTASLNKGIFVQRMTTDSTCGE